MEEKELLQKYYLGGKRLKFLSNKKLIKIFITILMPLSKAKTIYYLQIINFTKT